jgi:hypothetical protein
MRFALFAVCFGFIFGFYAQKNPKESSARIASEERLNSLLDAWHRNATLAKFDDYFAATADDFVFCGTAPGEKWDKSGFMAFCKPYFDSTKTWKFVPSNRVWYFSENGKTAWFDEDLETWMLDCRGSGVCTKSSKGWKIRYYNLTVVIENEKIKEFIELRKN